MKISNNHASINENNGDGTDLVCFMINKYCEKSYSPIKNISINIISEECAYKIIRLNDEQLYLLQRNSVPIFEDYGHLMRLSMDKDIIYSSFSKMYMALKSLFGESGRYYDDWKGSFSFPFLIHFQKGEEEFGYLMNIYNSRSSIQFKMAKLIHADEKIERNVLHNPFEEFSREEITYCVDYLVGFLTGYFGEIRKLYDEFFFHVVESDLILFGYKDGQYFDKRYENRKEYHKAIQEFSGV